MISIMNSNLNGTFQLSAGVKVTTTFILLFINDLTDTDAMDDLFDDDFQLD